MIKRIKATFGVALKSEPGLYGYYGWPSITKMPSGRLLVAASGYRMSHVCPFGKSIAVMSEDEGETWSLPMIANDTPLDDRDTGLTTLPDGRIALTWFTNTRAFQRKNAEASWWGDKRRAFMNAYLDLVTDEEEADNLGSFIRYSSDEAKSFGPKIRIPVTAPHGMTVLSDGTLFYLGKIFYGKYGHEAQNPEEMYITAYASRDGYEWERRGNVPVPDTFACANFHEPHSIELLSGEILGLVRVQNHKDYPFTVFETRSKDKGLSWSTPVPTGMTGSPPHIIRHSSGRLICVYAERSGLTSCQKAYISDDEGSTWEDFILDDRATDGDLGYPCSVELSTGEVLTVYYQKLSGDAKTSILTARWDPRSL